MQLSKLVYVRTFFKYFFGPWEVDVTSQFVVVQVASLYVQIEYTVVKAGQTFQKRLKII